MFTCSRSLRSALCAGLVLSAACAAAQDRSRGELLYTTHCIACHNTELHWRDQRAATDWPGLKRQVRRWQGNASLNWSEDDIQDVALYLNDSIYRFKRSTEPVAGLGGPPGAPRRAQW